MRSKILQKILDETPESVREKVREYAKQKFNPKTMETIEPKERERIDGVIKNITVDPANLAHIASTGRINGNLLVSLQIALTGEHLHLQNTVIEPLRKENEKYKACLDKVNYIRNGIIAAQKFNFSEHAYPLVAALNEAGIEGMPYPEAFEYYGTMLERTLKAESNVSKLEAENKEMKEQLRLCNIDQLNSEAENKELREALGNTMASVEQYGAVPEKQNFINHQLLTKNEGL